MPSTETYGNNNTELKCLLDLWQKKSAFMVVTKKKPRTVEFANIWPKFYFDSTKLLLKNKNQTFLLFLENYIRNTNVINTSYQLFLLKTSFLILWSNDVLTIKIKIRTLKKNLMKKLNYLLTYCLAYITILFIYILCLHWPLYTV